MKGSLYFYKKDANKSENKNQSFSPFLKREKFNIY